MSCNYDFFQVTARPTVTQAHKGLGENIKSCGMHIPVWLVAGVVCMFERERATCWIYPTSTHIQLSLFAWTGRFLLAACCCCCSVAVAVALLYHPHGHTSFVYYQISAPSSFAGIIGSFPSSMEHGLVERGVTLSLYTDHDEKWITASPPDCSQITSR